MVCVSDRPTREWLEGRIQWLEEQLDSAKVALAEQRDDLNFLQIKLERVQSEISKYLSPENQNVKNGDTIACIRDLAQAYYFARDMAKERDRRIQQGIQLGKILGREYDGWSLEEVAKELVRVRAENAELREELARAEKTLTAARDVFTRVKKWARTAQNRVLEEALHDMENALAGTDKNWLTKQFENAKRDAEQLPTWVAETG